MYCVKKYIFRKKKEIEYKNARIYFSKIIMKKEIEINM